MLKQSFALVRSDLVGNIVEWNEGAEEYFGYSRIEALGQSLDLIGPEEYRERHWAGFNRAIETSNCPMDRATTNVPVRCKDGIVRPFPGRFVFLQDARGEVAGVIGLYAVPTGNEEAFGEILPIESQG
jgi:PAS domain S-box-containing protein